MALVRIGQKEKNDAPNSVGNNPPRVDPKTRPSITIDLGDIVFSISEVTFLNNYFPIFDILQS